MLAALASLRKEKGFGLRCFHVEHGIRPAEESRGDADAVRELCKKLKVSCRVVHIPPGVIEKTAKTRRIGLEAAARLFRHAAWNREAARIGAERVLVAHTRDDLLETALMRFLRGAGPAGLAAMPRSRGRIFRPLLELSRSRVLAYLEERGIPFRTDSTNADSAFLRNRIRNRLVPFLDELFPGWRTSLAHLGETQRLAADFIAGEAERRIPWEADGRACRVSRKVFFSLPEILREEAVFLAADRFGGKGVQPRRESVRFFIRGGCRALDLGAFRLEIAGEWVIAAPRVKIGSEEGFSLLIKEPGIYKLDKYPLVLRCMPEGKGGGGIPGIKEKDPGIEERASGAKGCFRAGLPLVLRPFRSRDRISGTDGVLRSLDRSRHSGYTGYITAEDSRGVAAFIGVGKDGAVVITGRKKDDSDGKDTDGGKECFSFMI
jgi:tRNA(Ile)-lysidine synthase